MIGMINQSDLFEMEKLGICLETWNKENPIND
jgi:hypothetical protein